MTHSHREKVWHRKCARRGIPKNERLLELITMIPPPWGLIFGRMTREERRDAKDLKYRPWRLWRKYSSGRDVLAQKVRRHG